MLILFTQWTFYCCHLVDSLIGMSNTNTICVLICICVRAFRAYSNKFSPLARAASVVHIAKMWKSRPDRPSTTTTTLHDERTKIREQYRRITSTDVLPTTGSSVCVCARAFVYVCMLYVCVFVHGSQTANIAPHEFGRDAACSQTLKYVRQSTHKVSANVCSIASIHYIYVKPTPNSWRICFILLPHRLMSYFKIRMC